MISSPMILIGSVEALLSAQETIVYYLKKRLANSLGPHFAFWARYFDGVEPMGLVPIWGLPVKLKVFEMNLGLLVAPSVYNQQCWFVVLLIFGSKSVILKFDPDGVNSLAFDSKGPKQRFNWWLYYSLISYAVLQRCYWLVYCLRLALF